MSNKQPSAKQLAQRKAFGEAAKARAAAKRAQKQPELATPVPQPSSSDTVEINTETLTELVNRVKELEKSNLNFAAPSTNTSVSLGHSGGLIGSVDKYVVDAAHYPDPRERLAHEPRLAPVAFDYNYELRYSVDISRYTTKEGINMREPRFNLDLIGIKKNDQGEQTLDRYIVRRLVFHEDPEAALVIANEQGLEVDKSNEKLFLDEMRYLRMRDWLFERFWPKGSDNKQGLREEVIGNVLTQVYTVSSDEPQGIPFEQIASKL